MFDFFGDMFARFGIVVENRAAPQLPGVTQVRDRAQISSIFHADAARQQSELVFFNLGKTRRAVIPSNAAALGADPQRRR